MLEIIVTVLMLVIVILFEIVSYKILIKNVIDYKDKMFFYKNAWNIYIPLFRAIKVDPEFNRNPVLSWVLFALVVILFLPVAVLYTLFYPLLRAIFYRRLRKKIKRMCDEELPIAFTDMSEKQDDPEVNIEDAFIKEEEKTEENVPFINTNDVTETIISIFTVPIINDNNSNNECLEEVESDTNYEAPKILEMHPEIVEEKESLTSSVHSSPQQPSLPSEETTKPEELEETPSLSVEDTTTASLKNSAPIKKTTKRKYTPRTKKSASSTTINDTIDNK